MFYWKGDKFWVGELLEHPEMMTQGKNYRGIYRKYERCLYVNGYG